MGSKNKKKSRRGDSAEKHSTVGNGGEGGGSKLITDERFKMVHWDPRFQRMSKHKAKVEIDSRFSRACSDKSFSTSAAPLDKRGKPKKQKSQNPLQRYYRIKENKPKEEETEEDEDEEEEEEENEREELGKGNMAKRAELSDESEKSDSGSEDEVESADSESTADTDEEDVYEEEEAEVQEESIPNIEKKTHRLAIVNMDWRLVKAVDLYVVLSSFLPSNGRIVSVAVYPSEFGLQRMKEEEVHGPVGLFDDENGKEEKDNDEDDDNNDDEMDNEKLLAYERSRLRYYFAVVECDSSATADYLYSSCDGVEFERSSNVLDLRFIPDSMEFKHPPRDIATEAPANYDGLDFQTRVLQQSKIQLTWDEDEPDRVKTLKRKFNADQQRAKAMECGGNSDIGFGSDDPLAQTTLKTTSQHFFGEDLDDPAFSISIIENMKEEYGLFVWPCSVVLAEYVWQQRSRFSGTSVIELGAGTSLPGLVAAKLGSNVTLTDDGSRLEVLDNMKTVCELNNFNCKVMGLTWGVWDESVFSLSSQFILGADVLYDSSAFDDLFATVSFLLQNSPGSIFIMTYHNRSGHHRIEFLMAKWDLKCSKLIDGFSIMPPTKASTIKGHNIQLAEIVMNCNRNKVTIEANDST